MTDRSTRRLTSASLLMLSAAWAWTAHAEPKPAAAKVSAEAAEHFSAGVAHLQSGAADRVDDAYREFKAAYATSPTWKILGNMGIAAQKLERFGEAADAFAQYLARGGAELSARETKQVRADLAQIQAESATVTLEADGAFHVVDTRLDPGGASVVNEYGPFEGSAELRVRAGRHSFRIERDGERLPPWSILLLAGDVTTHRWQAEREPEPSVTETVAAPALPAISAHDADVAQSPSRVVPYVLWGVGAAAAGASVVLYLRSNHLQDQADASFERDCLGGATGLDPCGRTTPGDEKAASWKTAALFTGLGALTAAVGGTLVYFLDGSAASETDGAGSATQGASVGVWATPTSAGISGTF